MLQYTYSECCYSGAGSDRHIFIQNLKEILYNNPGLETGYIRIFKKTKSKFEIIRMKTKYKILFYFIYERHFFTFFYLKR